MAVVNPNTVARLRLLAKTTGKEDHRNTNDVLEMFQRMNSVMNVRRQGQDVWWNDKYRCVLRPRAGGDRGGNGGVEDQAGCFDMQGDLDRATAEEDEDDEMILAELARELADAQPGPSMDELLLAAVGNYAGYLARKVQANSSVSECCKQELTEQEKIEIVVELERGDPPSVMFDALVKLVDRGELETGWAVLKQLPLPMAHMVSFGLLLSDSMMCREHKKEHRVRFLSLAMSQGVQAPAGVPGGLRPDLAGVQVPAGVPGGLRPDLAGVRVPGGAQASQHYLAAHQQVPLQLFGANSKDVTSEVRKNKALEQLTGTRRSRVEEARKEVASDRNLCKSRKLTGAHKSKVNRLK